MMMMLLRMIAVWATRKRRGRLSVLATGVLRQRVWPGDLDLNLHMNNGRYFSIADLGRFDLWLRTGIWKQVIARGWHPVAGDSNGRFSRSLRPFERYELRTRTLGWNEKWFFVEHRFVVGPKVAAVVVVRYLFTGSNGGATPDTVLGLIGHTAPSPALPDWIQNWELAQTQLTNVLKAERHLSRNKPSS